ncbi:MAG: OmpH family outer membrane protein [Myxococcales bacterium]|nr:OmpH family outer membrane protein [Myxococcales bacterium]
MKSHLLSAILGVAFISAFAPKAAAQDKIAVVDLQRAITQTEEGRQAKAKLTKLFAKRQKQIDAKTNDLKKMKEDIEKQKDVLSREAMQGKLEVYQKSFVELQTVYMEYQKEISQKEGQLTKGILERMQKIVERIGQAKGYSLVVERNEGGVVWAPSSLDITDDVIQRYNKGEGK